jgi:hypothetical protein
MAKTKNRGSARKKGAKRGKANVKPARKKIRTRATAKRAKSKVVRTVKRATKSTAEEKPASAESSPVLGEAATEATVITVIEEPTGGVVLGEPPEQKVA